MIRLALLCLLAASCTTRPTVDMRPTITPDGLDVAVTWRAFAERWPDQHRKGAIGCYDHATHSCWYVCADPSSPSTDEGYELAHEHCHRIEDERGTDVADPLWAQLPSRYLTHPEVLRRLQDKGLL